MVYTTGSPYVGLPGLTVQLQKPLPGADIAPARWAFQTGGTGHLYQGRFKSFPIQDDEHLLTVMRYVERNPLRAAEVSATRQSKFASTEALLQKENAYLEEHPRATVAAATRR